MSEEQVRAVSFTSETVSTWLGLSQPERAVIIHAELANGRTVTIDEDGVYDKRDLPRGDGEVQCLFWDEILAALDAKRVKGAN